jgi:hypothetical protein
MSYQEKNKSVTLVIFSLILGFYSLSILLMVRDGTFASENVFRLWGMVIGLAVIGTILATILTHIVSAVLEAIRTKQEPDIREISDERDTIIDLRGTKITYTVSSLGGLFAMLAYVFGQPALVVFSLIVFFGLVAQVVGDISRLYLYKRGF